MIPRFAAALVAALAFAAVPAAHAESVDASAFTCKELSDAIASGEKQNVYGATVLLSWLAGYHTTEEQGTVVDFDNLKHDTENITQFCSENPGVGVLSAASKYLGENATPATTGALDIATVKCERLANSNSDDDKDGAGVILMWLAGYFASDAEKTMIDFDELERQGTEIGKICAETKQMGLVTAARQVMQETE